MVLRFVHIALLLSVLPLSSLKASHIVGGEIYYTHLGGNDYRVFVTLYRDCFSTGAAFDNPMSLGIFNSSNQLVEDVRVPFQGSQILPVIFNNPCVVSPPNICTERSTYTTTVSLPPIAGGYRLVYQRCCRGPNIDNLVAPDDQGITLQITVPTGTNGIQFNSSPRFTNYPPLVICNNDQLNFDHSATDPDGDQLTYSLVTPFHGGTNNNPMPQPPFNPPYSNIPWSNGYSATQPLGPGSTLSIDPITGQLTGQPNLTGNFVVGVQVEERRNGVVVSRNVRDFLFVVISCEIPVNAILPTQDQLPAPYNDKCAGLTILFDNLSYGGTTYSWDFGDPTTTTDVSNQFEPSYTYPANGTYTVRLIASKDNCADTATMTITVNRPVNVNFDATDSVCFINHSIDFFGTVTNQDNGTLSWNFGPNASQQTANTLNVNNITFNSPGSFPVTFSYNHPHCQADTTINVLISDIPVADFELPTDYECLGQTIPFLFTGSNSIVFGWDFGVNGSTADVSTQQNPTFTYPGPGTYTITLISGSTGQCFDTIQKSYTIYQDLIMAINSEDSVCIRNNAIDFFGNVSGPDIASYRWEFGSNAQPSQSSDTNVLGVHFTTSGNHPVLLIGSYLHCRDTVQKNIFIYREPSIDFTIEDGSQCVPFPAQFINLSMADAPIYSFWDFGDGTGSTLTNPGHLFTQPGVYPITLRIEVRRGCTDTLTLTKSDLVDVKPKPVADFSLDRTVLDVCDNVLSVTDLSEGSVLRSYYMGEENSLIINAPNPFNYAYRSSGNKRIVQIVENEFGCLDTNTQQVYVEPYTVFIPNTFTPDGDLFNNQFYAVAALPSYEWHLQMFNRWGEKVWESYDQNAQWDGTYQGTISPDGIYTYLLQLTTCGGENPIRTLQGHVLLIR